MTDRRKIHFVSVLMCEDLRVEASGLQTIVGVMSSKVAVPAAPVTLPRLMFRIEFDSNETFSANCSFAMVNPGGGIVLSHDADFAIKKDLRNVFVVGWGPVVLPDLGRYSIRFGIGKEKKREVSSLEIVAVQAQRGIAASSD